MFGPQRNAATKETMLNDWLVFAVQRCRRSLMAVHFDEVWDDAGCKRMCDTCRRAAPGWLFCVSACRSTVSLSNKPQFDCWVISHLPIWTPALRHYGRREGTRHLGGGQAGGADRGGGLLPGGEGHSSEAAGHLAGQRSRQEEEDDQDHRAVAAAGWTSHRAPAAARLPQVPQLHTSLACLFSSVSQIHKMFILFLKFLLYSQNVKYFYSQHFNFILWIWT